MEQIDQKKVFWRRHGRQIMILMIIAFISSGFGLLIWTISGHPWGNLGTGLMIIFVLTGLVLFARAGKIQW